MLIPVKRFRLAKRRLAGLLDDDQRVALAQWLAGRVVAAAHPAPVFVACEDEAVAAWADAAGAEVLWTPGLGLNGAVESSRMTISGKGFDHLVIAHSDLPLAGQLTGLAVERTITLVPDRRGTGTNVLCLPVEARIAISYGPGSFDAHLGQALAAAGGDAPRRRSAPRPSAGSRRGHAGRSVPSGPTDGTTRMVANDPGQPALSSPGLGGAQESRDAAALAPTTTIDLDVPASALAVGAHPDDIEFGAGATLAKWADRGCVVHHLVCTDGSKGTWDPDADTEALVVRRREEQREAARRIAGRAPAR